MDDIIPLERAGRILAPFSQHIERRYFDGGTLRVLGMLGEVDIEFEARSLPSFMGKATAEPLTREWFAEMANRSHVPDYRGWAAEYWDWATEALAVSRADIIAHMRHPSGRYHQPIEHVEATGTSWSLLQALAWIATRSALEVARMVPAIDWPGGERQIIGWLVVQTSLNHCRCRSAPTDERERWEACQCVGAAYDELRGWLGTAPSLFPEYKPEPEYASFALAPTPVPGSMRLSRREIMTRWPAVQNPWTPESAKEW